MVVLDSVTLWVKAEEEVEGILETNRVKSSGLSAVQVMEKVALGSMLYLLVSPSSTLSEEWREAMGGAVRSVVNTREPVKLEGRTRERGRGGRQLANNRSIHVCTFTSHTIQIQVCPATLYSRRDTVCVP